MGDSERSASAAVMSVPSRIGRHRILGALGQGGMSLVYLAASGGPLGFAKVLVIKVLRPELAKDPELVSMFLDEGRLAARLSHPNLVQTFEIGEDHGLYYLAMEHLEGQPLHRVLARLGPSDRLTVPMIARLGADVLHGLHHAHELVDYEGRPLGVVHRDVSPQNVFVTYDGLVKLVDFGIAKANDSSTDTKVGTLKGKLAYMAPEQALGGPIDRRADVFACGVVLYEALSGRRMWDGLTEARMVAALVKGQIPRLSELAIPLPRRLVLAVDRALSPRPEDRFPTAAAFARELEAVLETFDVTGIDKALANEMKAAFVAERESLDREVRTQLRKLEAGQLFTPRPGFESVVFGTPTQETDSMHTLVSASVPRPIHEEDTKPSQASLRVAGRKRVVAFSLGAALLGATAAFVLAPSRSAGGEAPRSGAELQSDHAPRIAACDSPAKPLVELTGELDESATLGCDKDYLLRFHVFVKAGTTLRIAPGTRILGDAATQATLVVEPGARLVAEGTPERPIVFTSSKPDGQRAPGDWGGVIVLGRAPINLRDAEGKPTVGQIEGLVEGGAYGGDRPDDDSGSLRYVRIEYGGVKIAPNNEINGLTLGGVGRGTRIDHVQVRHTKDDCFEFFGGTVHAKYLICDAPGDDGFDWDYGYQGRLEFLLFRDDDQVVDGNHGLEGDNDPSATTNAPVSAPTIRNVTLCASPAASSLESFGALLRRGTGGTIANVVVSGFKTPVELRDRTTTASLRSFTTSGVDGGAPFACTRERYRPDQPIHLGAERPPADGFFDPTAVFLGAFRDENDRWDEGAWSVPLR